MIYLQNSKKLHYNKKYFDWQKKAGLYGAEQDVWMYQSFIKEDHKVLDFGCGGGYMLDKINSKTKYGVDINPLARKEAGKKGIKVFEKIENTPKGIKFDVIFTHHTLEHLESPAEILKTMKKYLKLGGLLICVVPIDDWRIEKKYISADINKHFYTWSPLLLGNLFVHCGYKIKNIQIIERAWVPLSRFYYSHIPKFIYNFFSLLWSKLTLSRQIRIVAQIS